MCEAQLTCQLQISNHNCCVLDATSAGRYSSRVVVASHQRFNEHITKIVRKAHKRANLIHRCFTCKDCDMLVKAFKVYVRPILEYTVPVWLPSFVKDILLIESVQRKFTKRIPGMSGLTYHSRLTRLGLASLRLRADITGMQNLIRHARHGAG